MSPAASERNNVAVVAPTRPSPSRIHWKFNTSGSASQTCVILLQKEQLLHYMSPRREFFSTFLASPIAVFLFGVRQDQDSSALSFPRSFSLLPCRLVPGHSPFESELIERGKERAKEDRNRDDEARFV